MKTVSLLLKN